MSTVGGSTAKSVRADERSSQRAEDQAGTGRKRGEEEREQEDGGRTKWVEGEARRSAKSRWRLRGAAYLWR